MVGGHAHSLLPRRLLPWDPAPKSETAPGRKDGSVCRLQKSPAEAPPARGVTDGHGKMTARGTLSTSRQAAPHYRSDTSIIALTHSYYYSAWRPYPGAGEKQRTL